MPDPYSGEPKCLVMTNAPTIEITDSDHKGGRIPSSVRVGQQYLPVADRKHKRYWLDTVAMYVMHDGKFWPGLKPTSKFRMDRFPEGYELYYNTRGDRNKRDYYLHGFRANGIRSGRPFRSPQEFALHAKWLAFGRPSDACECTYCSGTPQSDIEERLSAATAKAEMPRRPGVDLTRSGSRKKNNKTGANSRAGKRSRLSDTILIKDYTKGPSYVSELHKKQMAARASD